MVMHHLQYQLLKVTFYNLQSWLTPSEYNIKNQAYTQNVSWWWVEADPQAIYNLYLIYKIVINITLK